MAAKQVKVHDEDINIDISASNKQAICFFCHRQFAKYTCPRCNVSYCSTACYKSDKHLRCSEGFYRDSVVQELTHRVKDPKDVQNVLRMLKKLDENDSGHGESDDPSIDERFADINLNTTDVDVIWNALTREEQREFEESLKSGELCHMINEWIPWWQSGDQRSSKADIQVIGSRNSQEHDNQTANKPRQSCPKVIQKIPPLTGSVNPLIKYSIIDVLYSYVYVMRFYNGEPEENLNQFVSALYELASSLSKNLNFASLEMMVYNSLNVVQENKDIWNSQEFSYTILLDVCQLLSGTVGDKHVDLVDCALSDVCRLFTKVKKSLKCEKGSDQENEKKMFLAKKKVDFFLSWTQGNKKIIYSLVPGIKAIHLELMSSCRMHDKEKRKMDGKMKMTVTHKTLIEEL